ncbi:structural protein [Stenotrophomonas phage vB_SmaS-AXL_1]|uniref:structural protein n=1 Tax=Stenotrophomonas phage vB_SmaS-AXL_1 TaxID=2909581 RepID=UPI00240A5305|nr:structural protein [Stenotrophomonas phage vB_SmaS-AXL_1]UIS24727.1 structural protein [Stenotrophomonas phage vB_SmaS-AXL_1]
MGGGKKQTIGYKYFLGMHMVLAHGPLDKLTEIRVDDKLAWKGTSTGGPIMVCAPNLFGGKEREGGVGGFLVETLNKLYGDRIDPPLDPNALQGVSAGTIDVMMGRDDQAPNAYLASQLGGAIPAFRRVMGVVLRRCYLGNNPYLKLWSFRGSRIHTRQNGIAQWYDAKAEIAGDMNPAHIIREVLTDPDWGMGYPEGDMDETAFRLAADQLHSENMGMSLLWDTQQDLSDFLAIVLRHIDGSLFTDRATGRFVLKLARGGYDESTLLLLDEQNVIRVSDFKRRTVDELTNQVSVKYWEKSTGKDGSITVQDIALAANQGTTVGTTIQYPGFTNGAIATVAAARDLKALSIPLATATLYVTRAAALLNIGDVFRFSWEEYGIENIVFRVTNIELGELQSNQIKLSVVEDVFSLTSASYAPPPPSEWQPPSGDAAPSPYRLVMDSPYYLLVREIGDTSAQALPKTAGYAVAAGVSPGGTSMSMAMHTNAGAGYTDQTDLSFCPSAVIQAAYSDDPTVVTFSIGVTTDWNLVQAGDLAVIGYGPSNSREIVQLVVVSDTEVTVRRAVLDSVPREIASGARLMVLGLSGEYTGMDSTEYAPGEQVSVKLTPTAAKGQLPLASAPVDVLPILARQARPYPPGLVRVDGARKPATATGPVVITWAHRDRTQQTGETLIGQDESSVGPETGVRYGLRFLDAGGLVLVARDNISGTSATGRLAYTGNVTMELYSISDAGESINRHVRTFAYTPEVGATESTITAGTWTPDEVIFDGGGA